VKRAGAPCGVPALFMPALLEAVHLTKKFGGLTAVRDFSLKLAGGELWGLIGPNGAGKTTVFNMLTGILQPDGGEIYVNGENLTRAPPWRFTKAGVARTFQNLRLLWDRTVEENLLFALSAFLPYNLGDCCFYRTKYFQIESKAKERIAVTMQECGLAEYKDVPILDLPYGVQRKVEIARALLLSPKLLLLDEPTAGIHPNEIPGILTLLQSVWENHKITMIVIEHNMRVIMSLAQHIIVMCEGQIIAQGPPVQIQNDPEVIRIYLGERYVAR